MTTKTKVIISYIVCAIVIIFLVVFASNRHEKLKTVESQAKQNLIALTDTISEYKTRNGLIVKEKAILQLSKADLKIANDGLLKLTKSFKDSVIVITKTVTVIMYDTIQVTDGIVSGDAKTKSISFDYNKDPYAKFSATTTFDVSDTVEISNAKFTLSNLVIDAPIILAIVDDKGIKKIDVTSPNPNVKFISIEGNIVPEDPVGFFDKFGFGVAVGPTVNYDIIDRNWSVGVGITAGFVYKKIKR